MARGRPVAPVVVRCDCRIPHPRMEQIASNPQTPWVGAYVCPHCFVEVTVELRPQRIAEQLELPA